MGGSASVDAILPLHQMYFSSRNVFEGLINQVCGMLNR